MTLVTSKRRDILLDNIKILEYAFKKSIDLYNYELYAVCILPDHLHMIIKPHSIKDYPNIVKLIKTTFSKKIDRMKLPNYSLSKSNIAKQEFDVWQRRYFEHTIVSEKDLYKHTDYIHYNPVKHKYTASVKDWEASSFHRFVEMGFYEQNWCNFEDKYNINNFDLE